MSELELLTERGFMCFLNNFPYWIRMWGDAPWLFFWHSDGHWVSQKQLTQTEVWICETYKMTEKEEDYYREKHAQWCKRLGGL